MDRVTLNMIELYDLRCENLSNPIGIDEKIPRVSWKIKTDENNFIQKSYQIVYESVIGTDNDGWSNLWDSGKVDSAQNHLVEYKEPNPISMQRIRWRVRIWKSDDNHDNPSE
ncbi:MAG: hypothetical protein GF364_09775 [Candidatus Lokiarchaeota archaeon]|nr:hypothetical protein [Candidatus Lokiarchaeota archaeon]